MLAHVPHPILVHLVNPTLLIGPSRPDYVVRPRDREQGVPGTLRRPPSRGTYTVETARATGKLQ